MKFAFKCCIAYLSIYITACSADNQQSSSEPLRETKKVAVATCTIPEEAFTNLPEDVLAGTEVLPLDDFETIAPTEKQSFMSEMGGAVLQLDIERDSKTKIAIVRKYAEPGMPAESKHYTDLCINESRIYGPGVRGIFVHEGLLWLELNSGNDFISPDLWVLMQ